MNLLTNPSFEGGLEDKQWYVHPSGCGLLPKGWVPFYTEERTEPWQNFRPEYGYPERYDPQWEFRRRTGEKSFGWGSDWHTHKGGALYVFEQLGLTGKRLRFSAWGYYLVGGTGVDNLEHPGAVHDCIGIAVGGEVDWMLDSITWSIPFENVVRGFNTESTWQQHIVEATATADRVALFLYTNPTWAGIRTSGPNWDDVSLEIMEDSHCYGLPRIDYKRVVNVIPYHKLQHFLSKRRAHEVLDKTWPQMIGNSYDGAGLGDLSDKTAALWHIPKNRQKEYRDWYAREYPGTKVEFKNVEPEEPELTLYSQRDPRWRDYVYGGGITLGQAGCLITCVAMLTGDEPPEAARKLSDAGALVGAYLSHPELSTNAYPDMPYGGTVHWRNYPADLDMIAKWLESGPVVVETEFSPGGAEPPSDQHFVIGLEIDDDDLVIADPWTGEIVRLMERYALANWDLSRAIYGARLFGHTADEPSPLPPSPPPERPEYIAPHLQTRADQEALETFMSAKNPRGIKLFHAQDCVWAHDYMAAQGKQIWTNYRKHFSTQDLSSSPERIAKFICDSYEGDIRLFGDKISSIEGFNEIMNSDADIVRRVGEIEIAFMREVERRQWPVVCCVHNTGVGNPHESQVELMLQMVEVAVAGGHILGLHCYGGANPWESFLVSDAPYHAMRYAEQDKVFVRHGLKPKWFLSEAGPIGAGPRNPDTNYLPLWFNQGWRHSNCMNEDWLRCYNFLELYSNMIHEWNLKNEMRVIAYALFTSGGPEINWDWFLQLAPQWLYLASH